MGEKNRSGIRVERRGGKDYLVVDFWFLAKDGRRKRYRRDASVQTKSAARAEAERLRRYAMEHGTVEPPPALPTFRRFVEEQYMPLVLPRYAPSTSERYERLLLKEGIVETLGAKRIDDVEARAMMELHAVVYARGTTPRQHHILVRGVLREAVRLGVLARMPELPPAPKQSRKLPAAPPPEVIELLLRGSRGWLRVAIALAYFATMRNGEVRAFRAMDADVAHRVVHIRRAFSHDQVRMPKSGADRSIPMGVLLHDILVDAAKDKRPTDPLVADSLGRVPSRQRLYKEFIALQRRLGISPRWSFHQLRHAFGTHAVRNGANIEAIRELMGHRDLGPTTLYVHAVALDKVAVIDGLDRGLKGQLAGN